MARETRQAGSEHSGGVPREPALEPAGRQRLFGEAAAGWTLIGSDEEPEPQLAPATPEPAEPESAVAPPDEPAPREPPTPDRAPARAEVRDPQPASVPAPPPFREVLPRTPAPAPRPSRLAPVVAALALAGLGVLAWRHVRVVRALEGELAQARAAATSPTTAVETAELERLRAETLRLEHELDDVARQAAQAEAAAQREVTERERAALLAAERDSLRLELDRARADLGRAEARLRALDTELARERDAAPAPAIGPAERRAELCERVLARVEAGDGQAARALLEAGRAAGLLEPLARDGSAFLTALVAAAEELERARLERSASTSPASRATLASLAHLSAARAGFPEFEREAADWLVLDVRGGPAADPGARAQRAERALASLEDEGRRLGGDVEALHAQDWTWIASRGALQDPVLALEHARDFGCGHLADLARDGAAALGAQTLDDGVPQPERLLAAESLPAWAELLAALAPAERGAAELELLWLDAARRWYALGADAAGFDWHGLAAPQVERRARDWRAELWLRVSLAAPGSAWPPRPGELCLYRLTGPSRARWRSDRRVDEGRADGWTWLRTHFDADGATLGEPTHVEVELQGGSARLTQAELLLLDLRAAQPGCEVAPAPDAPIVTPPAATGFGERAVLDLAAEATRSTCLIVPQGDTTRWFSPRLGLVLEERELASGVARVELVLREELP